MRAVLQRVQRASVEVDGQTVGAIDHGWLVLFGVARGDGPEDLRYLVDKTLSLRAFPDEQGKMNRSVREVGGAILVVSQFTLLGDCRKGRRPSFGDAADPSDAERLYREYVEALRQAGVTVATGTFQAHMLVSLTNDGPVTFVLDSRKVI